MADGIEILTELVQGVEEQVGHLTGRVQVVGEKVDRLSASMDQRFDAVDAAFLDQRQYVEFAHSRLEERIERLDGKVERLDGRVDRLDVKVESGLSRLDDKMDAGFERIERKLDRLIDTRRPRRPRKPRR